MSALEDRRVAMSFRSIAAQGLPADGTGENCPGRAHSNRSGRSPTASMNPGSRQGSGKSLEQRPSSPGRSKTGSNRIRSFKSAPSCRKSDVAADGPAVDPALLEALLRKYANSDTLGDAQSIRAVYATFMFQLGEQDMLNVMMNGDDDTLNHTVSLDAPPLGQTPSDSHTGVPSTVRERSSIVPGVPGGNLRYTGIEEVLGFYGLTEEKPEELQKRIYQVAVAQARERAQPPPKRTDPASIDFEGMLMIIEDIVSGRKVKISKPLIPIDPDGMPKQVWDCFIMSLLFYTCFAVPYLLAFETPAPNLMDVPYNVFDVTLDIIFMLDMGVSFVTAYYVEGVFVNSLRLISLNYLKTWFLLDLAGSFPFDKVIMSIYGPTVDLASMRILKAVRMMKLIRAVKFLDHLNRLQEKPGFGAFKANLQIFKCVFMLVFVSHLLGCIFTMLIDKEGPNWLETYDPNLVDAPNEERYLVALYYAVISLSTMGYGDVLPITTSEKVFGVFIAIVGAIVFSYCMGTITSLITQIMGADAKFDTLLTRMDEWLDYRNVPQKTRMMVRRHMYGVVRKGPQLFSEMDNLAILTPHLRSLVLSEIAESGGKMSLNLFKGLSIEEKGAIMVSFESERYVKDEVVYCKGDRGDRLCGIVTGTVRLYHSKVPPMQKGKVVAHVDREERDEETHEDDRTMVSQGHIFGELCLFENLARVRTETAVCTSDVHLLTLSRASYERLLEVHPLLAARIRKYCELLALQKGDEANQKEGKQAAKVRESALDMALRSAFEAVVSKNVTGLNLQPSEFTFSAWRPRETPGCIEDAYHCSILDDEKKALVKDVFVVREDGEVLVWEGTLEGLRAARPTSLGHLTSEVYQEGSREEVPITQTGRPFVTVKKVFELKLLVCDRSTGAKTQREVRVFVDRKHHDEAKQKLMQFKDNMDDGRIVDTSPLPMSRLPVEGLDASLALGLKCPADVSFLCDSDIEIPNSAALTSLIIAQPRQKLDLLLHDMKRAEVDAQVQELRERMSGMDRKMDQILGILSAWGTA